MRRLLRATFFTLLTVLVVAFASAGLNYLNKSGTVTRESLGIAASEGDRCIDPFAPFPAGEMNAEFVANKYLPYAIASLNAYADPSITQFVLARYDPGWTLVDTRDKGSVHFDVFFRGGHYPTAIVAFRGTRGPNIEDWITNLSWITTLYPVADAFAIARSEFKSIREKLSAIAGGKTVNYVVTGHSLGGGLAQHIANGFPCVSAAVFDTSPVVFRYVYQRAYEPTVSHIFDTEDELTKIRELIFKQTDTDTYHWYPINLVPNGTLQHDILRFAVGMSRMVAACQHDRPRECAIPQAEQAAKSIYCPTYGRGDSVCEN